MHEDNLSGSALLTRRWHAMPRPRPRPHIPRPRPHIPRPRPHTSKAKAAEFGLKAKAKAKA